MQHPGNEATTDGRAEADHAGGGVVGATGAGRAGPSTAGASTARVLVIGLDPAQLQGWDPEPVLAAIARGRDRFDDLGLTADWCLVAPDDQPAQAVAEALASGAYECVVVGGGLRKDDPLLELFEQIINLVRQHAPTAAIAFNSSPDDCADAALRWLK
ncbi:hypothetical protein [Kribbella italica]|uniref:Uncharacterized protein n=1 Tax=Kribbella italica TaxID=1540520 RepID=A0A7W9MTG6_9ACTN|nr:hypothetical protein [Kribbella italica]MBB5835095.1 hypothetical protein [Kribbella italica]